MMKPNHPFHIVTPSPWPILTSLSSMALLFNLSMIMTKSEEAPWDLTISVISTSLCMIQWWRDTTRESTIQGCHSKKVLKGLKMGMMMFIISEVLLFASLFWMLFHLSLSPNIFIGMQWPPPNITPFNPLDIPLLNSILLITSGMFLTWSHYELMSGKKINSIISLFMSLNLGLIFLALQMYEYKSAQFSISDSVYGSSFFMITGFHGMHVILGCTFLMTALIRMSSNHLSPYHHFNFEAAAWYWHFVDIIWLLVYISVYF